MAAPLKQCLLGVGQLTSRLGQLSLKPRPTGSVDRALTYCMNKRNYSGMVRVAPKSISPVTFYNGSLTQTCSTYLQPIRTKTSISLRKGKEKTVSSVVARFKRMQWGGWIRTKSGKNKRMWAKSPGRRYRLQQHVMCNGQQSKLLDKMVTAYWRKHRHYPDDPYAPYHKRTNYPYTGENDVPRFLP
ncbi:large ribosomal subunit protein bL35m-like [Argopecten irradians]|uniref:large ribosomal subunit protein bL35m-like n=1 Tax=Argopecten irradians TaxID=31199 RepID=UPI00371A75AB